MKNLLILGLVALLLFAVSAALSLWLNQSKEGEGADKKEAKKSAKESKADDDLRPSIRPNPTVGTEETAKLAATLREQLAANKEREARLDRRQAQIDLLLMDIRSEREALDALRKQVTVEMKMVGEKMNELDGRFVQLDKERAATNKKIEEAKKSVVDIAQNEDKNFVKMAEMYNAMAPESAAKILQNLVDTGKTDTAVKVLALMKETKAAKVLAEITDAALAATLLEKMRGVKRTPATIPQ